MMEGKKKKKENLSHNTPRLGRKGAAWRAPGKKKKGVACPLLARGESPPFRPLIIAKKKTP